jgi:hypothetical protein
MDRIIDGEHNEATAAVRRLLEDTAEKYRREHALRRQAEDQRDHARRVVWWRNAISITCALCFGFSAWHREASLERQRDQWRELAERVQLVAARNSDTADKCIADGERATAMYRQAMANDDRQWHALLWTAQECSTLAKKAVRRFEKCEKAQGLTWRTPSGLDMQAGPSSPEARP